MTKLFILNNTKLKQYIKSLSSLFVLFLLCFVLSVVIPNGKFLLASNLMNILKQASINCLIASGMLVSLITAGIDLSVGSNTVFCACIIGVLVEYFHITNVLVLIVVGILASSLAGFINGLLLTKLQLPHPYVSTLGMKNVLLGLSLIITGSKTIGFLNKGVDSLLYIGSATVGKFGNDAGFPISFIIVIFVFIIFDIFLNNTEMGRKIYCVGGNLEASRLSGINVDNVLVFVYTLSGFMCGIAGIVLIGRVATANANAGLMYDTDAIAACIIGGASFSGGKGTIKGTLIGALIMAIIRNGLNLLGASNDIQYVVIGLVIIIAVSLDVFRKNLEYNAKINEIDRIRNNNK